MAIRKIKPTSAGSRFKTYKTYSELTKDAEVPKSLLTEVKKTGGRNAQGKITVRNIGGANRRKYRKIDFKRNKDGIVAKVVDRWREVQECLPNLWRKKVLMRLCVCLLAK